MEKKSLKKIFIIVTVAILIIIFLLILSVTWEVLNSYRFNMYVNWNILLPKPNNINVVFKFDYREGEDFVVWHYKDTKKVVEEKKFNKIDEKNQTKVKSIIEKYYNKLDNKEKEKFNKNISIECLSNLENYYIHMGNDERYLLMIEYDNKIYSLFSSY
ncbi:MAG: hypothetical protein Q4F33_01970 [Mycoplasmatota bacterium]|nr:hypothetical protein [Mycoplasmatota bacterium]